MGTSSFMPWGRCSWLTAIVALPARATTVWFKQWPMLASMISQLIAPPDIRYVMLGLQTPATLEWQTALARLSPSTLYGEAMLAILSPSTRALGPIYLEQLQGAVNGAPLSLLNSLAIAWPQAVALIAGTIVLFSASYVVFQRQEVRA